MNQHVLDGIDIDRERVLISSWLPQKALLLEKSISLALLHGGMGRVHEALYSGVPCIITPISIDLFDNAMRVVQSGAGIRLDYAYITAEAITSSIRKIAEGKYRQEAKRMSVILRAGGGVERAADLVEHYAEVGYEHLVPAYVKYEWGWVEYYNMDVKLLSCLLLLLWVWLVKKLLTWLCRCCCGSRKKKTKID